MRTLIKVHLDCQNLRLGFLHAASNKPDRKDPSLLPPTDLHMKDNEWAMSKYPFVPGAHREHTPGTHSGSRERVGWAWAGSETAVGAAMHASKGRKMCAQRAMKVGLPGRNWQHASGLCQGLHYGDSYKQFET
eukprot:1108543-Pelagomonas_calceolata.AAC.1